MGLTLSQSAGDERDVVDLFFEGRCIGSVRINETKGKRSQVRYELLPEVRIKRRGAVDRDEKSSPAA